MGTAPRRRSGRIASWTAPLAVAAALATLLPATAIARASLPPKVKPAHATHGSFVRPTTSAPRSGGKARLGFCGGDDWEPNLAVDTATNHVYAVWAHYPGATACDPASGN